MRDSSVVWVLRATRDVVYRPGADASVVHVLAPFASTVDGLAPTPGALLTQAAETLTTEAGDRLVTQV